MQARFRSDALSRCVHAVALQDRRQLRSLGPQRPWEDIGTHPTRTETVSKTLRGRGARTSGCGGWHTVGAGHAAPTGPGTARAGPGRCPLGRGDGGGRDRAARQPPGRRLAGACGRRRRRTDRGSAGGASVARVHVFTEMRGDPSVGGGRPAWPVASRCRPGPGVHGRPGGRGGDRPDRPGLPTGLAAHRTAGADPSPPGRSGRTARQPARCARVRPEPGASARARGGVHADRTACTGRISHLVGRVEAERLVGGSADGLIAGLPYG